MRRIHTCKALAYRFRVCKWSCGLSGFDSGGFLSSLIRIGALQCYHLIASNGFTRLPVLWRLTLSRFPFYGYGFGLLERIWY
jgi:hypothetical protein